MSSLGTRVLLVAGAALLTAACTVRQGDFAVISNKLVNTTNFRVGQAERVKGVEGRDVSHIIIIIPTSSPPTLEGAVDDALEKGGGDVVTDAVVESWYWYIPYIYGQSGWSVKGDVVKTRGN
jgi:hypothetical protein